MSVFAEIAIIIFLILLNGLFVVSELSVISARKTRLEQMATQGNRQAQAALELSSDPNRMLSTVQIGITLTGIFTGAYGGARITDHLAIFLKTIPALEQHSQAIAFTVVVVAITYLTLILGELVPKRLALNYSENIACLVAIPLSAVAKIGAPVILFLSFSTDLILRFLGLRTTHREQLVTEEEIRLMFQQGTEAGMFEEAEQDMVEQVLELGDRRVSSLMTARPEIVWLDLEDSNEINRQKIIEHGYSRYPVCQGRLDEVLGVIHVTDLLTACFSDSPFDLTSSLRQPIFVPESTRGLKLLELFKGQSGNQIALIVDEYGVIQGIVTLNDILEAIIGNLPSLEEGELPSYVQREDGSWLLDGTLLIEDLKEIFNLDELPGEKQGNYHTLGGFIITHLGKIPVASDYFIWENLRIEVIDMDGNRIDKVIIMPLDSSIESIEII